MLLGYALTDDQLMEVAENFLAENFKDLDLDENHIGEKFARRCRNVIPNLEKLKDKEWLELIYN